MFSKENLSRLLDVSSSDPCCDYRLPGFVGEPYNGACEFVRLSRTLSGENDQYPVYAGVCKTYPENALVSLNICIPHNVNGIPRLPERRQAGPEFALILLRACGQSPPYLVQRIGRHNANTGCIGYDHEPRPFGQVSSIEDPRRIEEVSGGLDPYHAHPFENCIVDSSHAWPSAPYARVPGSS